MLPLRLCRGLPAAAPMPLHAAMRALLCIQPLPCRAESDLSCSKIKVSGSASFARCIPSQNDLQDPVYAPYIDQLCKFFFLSSAVHQAVFCVLSSLPFAGGQGPGGVVCGCALAVLRRCRLGAGRRPVAASTTLAGASTTLAGAGPVPHFFFSQLVALSCATTPFCPVPVGQVQDMGTAD